MEIWEINLIGKGVGLYFPRWIQRTHMASSSEDSTQGGPLAFKMEMGQQGPQEEEIPIRSHGGSKDLQEAPPLATSTL